MVAKRVLFPSSSPIAKRLRRVERIQRLRKPEMKYAVFQATGNVVDNTVKVVELSGIAEGNGPDQREGNHIKITRVEIRGYMATAMDAYIIQGHTTTVPAYADFNAVAGGALAPINNNTKFTEWKYFSGIQMSNNLRSYYVRFPYGLKCKYNGTASTNCVDNRLFLVIKNETGFDDLAELTVRVWYLDL